RVLVEEALQALAEDRVVVGEEDRDRSRLRALDGRRSLGELRRGGHRGIPPEELEKPSPRSSAGRGWTRTSIRVPSPGREAGESGRGFPDSTKVARVAERRPRSSARRRSAPRKPSASRVGGRSARERARRSAKTVWRRSRTGWSGTSGCAAARRSISSLVAP